MKTICWKGNKCNFVCNSVDALMFLPHGSQRISFIKEPTIQKGSAYISCSRLEIKKGKRQIFCIENERRHIAVLPVNQQDLHLFFFLVFRKLFSGWQLQGRENCDSPAGPSNVWKERLETMRCLGLRSRLEIAISLQS